jgi:hypothetical protein
MSSLETITATRTRAWPLLLLRVVLRTATFVVLLVALMIAGRRLAGHLEPLPALLLLLTGLLLATAALVWRQLWRKYEGEGRWQDAVARYAPAATFALLAIGLSTSGTHPLALVMFSLALIGEEVWAGMPRAAAVGPARSAPVEEQTAAQLPPGVSQQITRSVEAGSETLDCLLRATLEAGQQHETLHFAFCPPLLWPPTATCEQLSGAACEVKLAAIETYGARLEIKRRAPFTLADEVLISLHVKSHDRSLLPPRDADQH